MGKRGHETRALVRRTGGGAAAVEGGVSRRGAGSGVVRYAELLEELKSRIRAAQVRAALSVNRELVGLYCQIGEVIVRRQAAEGWGVGVVERLSKDLGAAFESLKGFSPRNIWRMRAFYLAWCGHDDGGARRRAAKLPRVVAELAAQFCHRLWQNFPGVITRNYLIGLILCRDRNQLIAEYALRDVSKPMGVATYATRLPAPLRASLPSPEQLTAELGRVTGTSSKSPKKKTNA